MNRSRRGGKGKSPSQPRPEKKRRSLSPTRLCRCSRFLSHRRSQSLPPNSTSCPSCFTSQRLEELERWDKILDEELERRMKEFEMIGELVLVSEQKLEKEFRLQEIARRTSFNFEALFPHSKSVHKLKAAHKEMVGSLYEDEKESLNKQIEELRLKKDQLQRDMKKIPKQSDFFREARKKKREQQRDDDDSDSQLLRIP